MVLYTYASLLSGAGAPWPHWGGRMNESTDALPVAGTFAERRRLEAQFRYLFALHAQAFSTPAPWEVLQEMEMDARFEHVANQERRL